MGPVSFFKGLIRVFGSSKDVLMLADEMTKCNIPFGALREKEPSRLELCVSFTKRAHVESLIARLSISVNTEVLGLPRLALLYKKRVGLFIGALLGTALILISDTFIWSYEVVGNESLSSEYVIELLESEGLRIGTLKKSHDVRMLALKAELKCDDIAWLAVNFKGTRAYIELRETKKKPAPMLSGEPCDVIAKCDGQIIYTEALSGSVSVMRRDVVKKGELLISGVVDSKAYGYKLVHASGRILAKTYRSFTVSVPLRREVKNYTGRTKSSYGLNVFGKALTSPRAYGGFEHFDVTTEKNTLCFFNSITLPVVSVRTFYKEYVKKWESVGTDLAKKEALAKLSDLIRDGVNGQILERSESESLIGDEYVLTVRLYCIEDIGVEKPIDKGWENVIK